MTVKVSSSTTSLCPYTHVDVALWQNPWSWVCAHGVGHGFFYATMIGTEHFAFEPSTPVEYHSFLVPNNVIPMIRPRGMAEKLVASIGLLVGLSVGSTV